MNGIMQLGNLFCKKNQVIVRDLEAVLAQRQREEDMRRVRSVTGLNFTPGNMLALHHELVNLQIDNMNLGSGTMRQEIRDTVQEINWMRLRITEDYEQRQQARDRNEEGQNETTGMRSHSTSPWVYGGSTAYTQTMKELLDTHAEHISECRTCLRLMSRGCCTPSPPPRGPPGDYAKTGDVANGRAVYGKVGDAARGMWYDTGGTWNCGTMTTSQASLRVLKSQGEGRRMNLY